MRTISRIWRRFVSVLDILREIILWFRHMWIAWSWDFARLTRATITVKTLQGLFTVSTQDSTIGRHLYFDGHYQHDSVVNAVAFLREKGLIPAAGQGTVLDIGANVGVISIGMLTNGMVASAVAVEPDPTNFGLLHRNVANNNLGTRYTAIQAAASERAGNLKFALSNENFGDHRIQVQSEPADDKTGRRVIEVAAKPIDEMIDSLPANVASEITLIWIDVQGHEGYVFAGGSKLFSRAIPVVVEVWPFGIKRSGMTVEHFCELAQKYWRSFWVFRRCGKYVHYPISDLSKFCEELGDQGVYEDIILTTT